MPWLTATAYIHSVLVQQRRGMLRVWNLSLLVATFALTILGTFLTRSGVIGSVHAFSAGEVDGYLLGFLALVVVVSLVMIAWRGDRLRSPGVIDSPVSREGAFLANNVVFAIFAFVVLLGTVFPLIMEALDNRRTVVGAPYFDRLSMPIGIALLFLMAVAPVLPWRKASQELLRDRLFWPAWCGALRAGRGRRRRCRRVGAAGRVRPRRVRRRVGAAPARARHATPGLAGPDGARQRRDDRAPRRDRRRRRAGGLERLHEVERDHAPRRRAGHVGGAHVRARRRHRRADRAGQRRARQRAARRRQGVRPGDHDLPPDGHPDRHAERARRPDRRRLPHDRRQPAARGRGQRGAPRGVPQATHHLALDRRADDGGRHAVRGVPRAIAAGGRSIPCRLRCPRLRTEEVPVG